MPRKSAAAKRRSDKARKAHAKSLEPRGCKRKVVEITDAPRKRTTKVVVDTPFGKIEVNQINEKKKRVVAGVDETFYSPKELVNTPQGKALHLVNCKRRNLYNKSAMTQYIEIKKKLNIINKQQTGKLSIASKADVLGDLRILQVMIYHLNKGLSLTAALNECHKTFLRSQEKIRLIVVQFSKTGKLIPSQRGKWRRPISFFFQKYTEFAEFCKAFVRKNGFKNNKCKELEGYDKLLCDIPDTDHEGNMTVKDFCDVCIPRV
eukprot:TRINITY_DN1838_c0_g1_i3.p1 TRINITY_DN1838_c0_g1~~TRINITY_DN1838_c0_g1_i3.p1  ORF type:complete len:262 (+),score=49.49 TRINITY_DN1838_c0_g1_i3:87-872(+)